MSQYFPPHSIEDIFALGFLKSKVDNLWHDKEASKELFMTMSYCQIRILWRAFVRPDLTKEQQTRNLRTRMFITDC